MDAGFTMASPEKYLAPRDRTVTVNFACQRCCQPLQLHSSFMELDDQTMSELTMPLYPQSDNDRNDFLRTFEEASGESDNVARRLVIPVKFEEVSNDFMVVGELASKPLDAQQTLRVSGSLFNIMSDQSDIDHPLCEECTDSLLDQMDQQLKIDEDECKEYRDFLEHLEMGNDEDDLQKLQEELNKLKVEEEQLQQELVETEMKEELLKKAIESVKEENEKIQREEDKYWQDYCRVKRQLLLSADDQRSVDNQLRYAEAQLDKLRKTNVFNVTFHIWHSGHFGTINNFRLGRLPNVPVEWPEIDAAWGQTVLLLHSLAKKIDLTFERYRLVPYGNHSYLESLEDKSKELPLYFMGGFKFFWDTKFDQAMVAFLDCLQQFKEKVEEGDTTFHLPYPMEKGKISDDSTGKSYSIKIQFNSEEQWTKALKFMLTNLKWALAWVSTQFQDNAQNDL